MDTVSVIVPVYNVGKYVDQCLESVTKQTYQDLEIIIIYDRSTDDSYARCLSWSNRDKRIRLTVNQNRGGLAAARNLGVTQATGKYVLFVDSDDWLDVEYIRTMRDALVRSGADFVTSSTYFEAEPDHISVCHGMPEGLYQTKEMREILLCGDFVTMWKKLYRREWLLEHQLMQPELFHYEDWGTYPLMAANAKTVYVSAVPGAYYRLSGEGSLSLDNEAAILADFRKTIQFMFDYLETREKYDPFRRALQYYCFKDYCMRMLLNFKSGNVQARKILEKIKEDILIPRFGALDFLSFHYIVSGSFSLRWEVQRACLIDSKVDDHFCFSSLISVCSGNRGQKVSHKNAFRQRQIEQEMESALLRTIGEAEEDALFFLDFMEERFDVLELEEGAYVTDSDAFRESSLANAEYIRRIPSGSDEHMALWKQACEKLVSELRRRFAPERIVLVKNRMAPVYGNFAARKPYENGQKMEEINAMLERMEAYFVGLLPNITVLENDSEYLFTDEQFRLGRHPEYANNAWYMKIGLQIFEKIA